MKKIVLAAMLGISLNSIAAPLEYPNPNLTGGVVDSNLTKEKLCAPLYPSQAFFQTYSDSLVTLVQNSYQAATKTCTYDKLNWQPDYLIPLQLGGAAVEFNTWAELITAPYYTPARKQVLADVLHAKVCSGAISLSTAQNAIKTNWRAAYVTYVNSGAPTPQPTITGLVTATNTPTNTPTYTHTPTSTNTNTNTPTNTATNTRTPTPTNTP